MMQSIIEMREYIEKTYPDMKEDEYIAFMHGYFLGIEHSREDVLERFRQSVSKSEEELKEKEDESLAKNIQKNTATSK